MAVSAEALRAQEKPWIKIPEPERKAMRSALIGGLAGAIIGAFFGAPVLGIGVGAGIAAGKTWYEQRLEGRRSPS